jgi:hypothetical protein
MITAPIGKNLDDTVRPLFTESQAQTIVDRGAFRILVFIERQFSMLITSLYLDGRLEEIEEYESTQHLRKMAEKMFIDPQSLSYEIIAPWVQDDFDKKHLQEPVSVE